MGTTDVSVKSVAVLAAMNASVVIFTGDLSYADGWVSTESTIPYLIVCYLYCARHIGIIIISLYFSFYQSVSTRLLFGMSWAK